MQDFYPDTSLSKYTFTKTGGNAEFLEFPKTIQDVKDAIDFAYQYQIPLTILGNASNVIISDKELKGLVIILTKMNQIKIKGNLLIAGAGASMINASCLAQQHSLSGLEFCAGLPGTVGGAEFMNASAYNGSTGAVTKSVTVIDKHQHLKTFNHQQMHFSYRHSFIQDHPNYVIVRAVFQLKHGNRNKIQALMDNFNAQREAKQPLNYPSCGSVFRRPRGHYVGQLIYDAKLQGYRYGGAKVSQTHAGFIINVQHATATDYLHVIHHVQHVIYKKNRIKLHTEVRILTNRDDKNGKE